MAWFQKNGYRVAPFKVGPDYIDPGHHSRITGVLSRNLDGWMLSREYNLACFNRNAANGDVAVIEGVMGLFDGYSGTSEDGSTAQMAKWLDMPVVLVVNAKSMARSAAAVVQGFENFDPGLRFAGVIFNNVGSERHLSYLKEALEGNVKMPFLGGIFRSQDLEIPERHLGLITDDEHILSDGAIDRLAGLIETGIDMPLLLDRIGSREVPGGVGETRYEGDKPSVKIAVARDKAFCFYYGDNLDLIEQSGVEIVYFSPMEDNHLPEGISGIYFGGGYPELFAEKLSRNTGLMEETLNASRAGMPIYGECGGLMYLSRSITDFEGRTFPMTDCLSLELKMLNRLKSLGYREVTLESDSILGKRGDRVRGHEFHYSEIAGGMETETVYSVKRRMDGEAASEGFSVLNTLGSYVHLHFGSNLQVAENFVASCREWGQSHNT